MVSMQKRQDKHVCFEERGLRSFLSYETFNIMHIQSNLVYSEFVARM